MLIVDDRPANLIALDAVLSRLAVRIVRAHSGLEALLLSAEQEFAVVLLDLRMPGLDGVETARLMGQCDPRRRPPVMILTAHLPELDEIKTAYAAGVVDFLLKPFAPEVLAAKVQVFVQLLVQREKLRLYEQALRKRFEKELVGIVSHDLRSPLNAISLAAESALLRAQATESDRRSLLVIRSAVGRATRLVRDLLDYTQVLHGTMLPVRRQKFCLFELAREIVDELRASFPATKFVFAHVGSTEGLWDRDRVAQVITNLVGNAAAYGGDAPVALRIAGDESEVSLQVHNGGEPIPAELLPELFQPLRRGNSSPRPGNIGLGLFIAKEVVRAHGGTITVQSSAELGTTFSATLPRGVVRAVLDGPPAAPREPERREQPGEPQAADMVAGAAGS